MSTARILKWENPEKKVRGFHVHQELPEQDFRKALVIQREEKFSFLNQHFWHDSLPRAQLLR
ncbi:MAG: hypothetical protein A3E83_07585 [Gammaproteobacteria bacterium RIFCSPHIGHO2_12_FULL_41_20]|nr:MAG: hypothetical protein A3E83_07585 [Gammaproteobacteria bacterium RIFCSPHIGHO2_12_FULL_41_20]